VVGEKHALCAKIGRLAAAVPKLGAMRHVFGKGGTLAQVLDEYEAREEQAELADAVSRALAERTHLLAEAERWAKSRSERLFSSRGA
jgi:hypothetical protein